MLPQRWHSLRIRFERARGGGGHLNHCHACSNRVIGSVQFFDRYTVPFDATLLSFLQLLIGMHCLLHVKRTQFFCCFIIQTVHSAAASCSQNFQDGPENTEWRQQFLILSLKDLALPATCHIRHLNISNATYSEWNRSRRRCRTSANSTQLKALRHKYKANTSISEDVMGRMVHDIPKIILVRRSKCAQARSLGCAANLLRYNIVRTSVN